MKRLAFILALTLAAAISPRPAEEEEPRPSLGAGKSAQPPPELRFSRLLVMPFARAPVRGDLWQCPRCGKILRGCPIDDGAEATLSNLLLDRFQNHPGFTLVSQEELNQAIQAIPEPELTQARLDPNFPIVLAERLKAEAALIPTVSCFRERLGNALASGRPAAVAFELDLVIVADRRVVWSGSYEEEQKALFENLLQARTFFRRGAKWVTVDVLATDGMAKTMAAFPGGAGLNPAPTQTTP